VSSPRPKCRWAMANDPELRFWRGKDLKDVLKNAEGPVGSHELGRWASLLALGFIALGVLARRMPQVNSRSEQIRYVTFKVLFPLYLLRTLWGISLNLGLAALLPISLSFHMLWFFLSQQLARLTPEAPEVQDASGRSFTCLVGWVVLMCQGENMAFTYPLIADAASSPVESLASAMMWDLGANIWLCQGFLWGIAAVYSPKVQDGAYAAVDCSEELEKSHKWSATALPAGTKEIALNAVACSILLRACLAGLCLNFLNVSMPWIVDASLRQIGSLCKALLYFLVGLYADFSISIGDLRFIGVALSQRLLTQIALALLLVAILPVQSVTCRNAILVTIFSPGPSVLMHILAETGYGDHLVKLCATGSLFNTVLSMMIQTALLELLPGEATSTLTAG